MSLGARRALTQSIRPSKQGARRHYGSHPYFTKRAWNVVQAYISHFSSPGHVVLDPFGGSGVAAVESLVLRRKALYADISEWACFLARQTAVAPVDLGRLYDAFEQLERVCAPELEALWATSNEELAGRPVRDWYPKDIPLPTNADVRWVHELFTPRMLHGLACLHARIMHVAHGSTRDLLLLAFSATLARINRTFLSAANRRESRGGSAIFSIYRYKVASRTVELPLWEQFATRVKRLHDAKRETNQLIGAFYKEGDTAVFRHGSATRLLEWIRPQSVDYIYTDPPYGAHIAYLDLSTMWAAWLGLDISIKDRAEEVIEGGEMAKSREVYHHLLCKALEQMNEVLKKGRWMSLVFAHRDTTYWEALVDACSGAGFEYVNTVVQPVGVVWSMHKKKNPLRVLSGELVLNFRKASRARRRQTDARETDATDLVRQRCETVIVRDNGATTEDLHHAIVPSLLENGLLTQFSKQWGDITPLLERSFQFDRQGGRWHLRPNGKPTGCLPASQLARYYIVRFLGQRESAERPPTELQVLRHVRSRLKGANTITDGGILKILRRVAYCPDERHWRLAGKHGQHEFVFSQKASL